MELPESVATTLPPTMDEPGQVAHTTWSQPKRESAVSSGPSAMRPRPDVSLHRQFSALAEQWRRETAPLSSVTEIVLHPAYQRIIGMGQAALPFILADLAQQPDHWFWALRAITAENPVAHEDAGNLGRMRDAWVRLGRERGWLG
jgi:hypothetical protein